MTSKYALLVVAAMSVASLPAFAAADKMAPAAAPAAAPTAMAPAATPAATPAAKADFATLDKNKDGFITKDEWPATDADGFKKLDTNGDGKISKDEYDGKAAAPAAAPADKK